MEATHPEPLGYGSRPAAAALRLSDNSATGTRARVARVKAEYPNQLDYSGFSIVRCCIDALNHWFDIQIEIQTIDWRHCKV